MQCFCFCGDEKDLRGQRISAAGGFTIAWHVNRESSLDGTSRARAVEGQTNKRMTDVAIMAGRSVWRYYGEEWWLKWREQE